MPDYDKSIPGRNTFRLVEGSDILQIAGFSKLNPDKCFCTFAEGNHYHEQGIATGSLLLCQNGARISDGDLVLVDEGGVPTIFLYQKSRKKKPTGEQRILHDKSKAFAKILGSFNIYC